ncbi:hypothetical protein E4T42_08206 [Aureobasidium subglaciale]|nr:hypothetical protein E4T42_08206 [Aureobasidium subglaciale]
MAPNTTQAQPFVCRICNTGTANKAGMRSHITNVHEPIKPFECANCTVNATRTERLEAHSLAVHNRRLLTNERVPDAAILKRVKDQADACEVAVHPPLAQGASTASHAPSAPPAASAPAHNPTVALPSLRPATEQPEQPEAPTSDVQEQEYWSREEEQEKWSREDEQDQIPGYFSHFGVGFNTGPDIPGGNRHK